MTNIKIEWKIIPGFPNYECSKNGDIRNKTTKRVLKPQINEKGYARMNLKLENGKPKNIQVHGAIAKTWIPNPDNKKTVDHKNRIRDDNKVENLTWATHKEQKQNTKISSNNTARGIWKIDLKTNAKLKYYNTILEASLDTLNKINGYKNISYCALGKTKFAYGFKWEYDNQLNYDENEIWKLYLHIRKNNYYISNYGRIRNNNRILKSIDDNGYCGISIDKKFTYIHILVAKLFIDNPTNYTIVNHKDGNKKYNHVDNLEWTDYSGNAKHSVEIGLRSNCKKVVNYNINGKILGIYTCPSSASRELKVNCTSVNKCCKGTLNSCGVDKLYFKYLDDTDDIINKQVSSEFLKKKFEEKPKSKGKSLGKPIKIAVYDNDDKLLSICNSKADAKRIYNVNHKTINYHIKHGNVATTGYKFKIYNE